ncbi:hypothetical protein CRG98_037931 [Punica granatum]|uniref:Uncharacterized protein n=1 Tax=Punica granatum TaxID=22663 RepID=A0A2I0ICF1_PUNGR|nr:hypothetical protein CRG98_037931 [Punica granatum]
MDLNYELHEEEPRAPKDTDAPEEAHDLASWERDDDLTITEVLSWEGKTLELSRNKVPTRRTQEAKNGLGCHSR